MPSTPTPDQILDQLLTRFPGTTAVDAWGETSLFYNPGQRLPRGVYFATIKQKDGENDKASRLDRQGVFRLNLGTSKPLFVERFGAPPKRPAKGECVAGPWDFTELDQLTDRFTRGENARNVVGSGLGLTIVKEVVEAHG